MESTSAGQGNTQNGQAGGYNNQGNNGYVQNKGYQAKTQQTAEQKMNDFYAAQNSPAPRNEYGQNTYTIEAVDNIDDIPVNGNNGMPVF